VNKKEMQQEYPPLYKKTADVAIAAGELDKYRSSMQTNIECRDAIEKAIRDGFDGMHLPDDCAKDVLEKFGPERVSYVLANTVQQKDWDGRFSNSNRQWAKTVRMFIPEEKRDRFIIESHSTILDGFIDIARKDMSAAREQPKRETKKPSVLSQLAAKPVSDDKPVKKPHHQNKETR